jgi:hypothetical protein
MENKGQFRVFFDHPTGLKLENNFKNTSKEQRESFCLRDTFDYGKNNFKDRTTLN